MTRSSVLLVLAACSKPVNHLIDAARAAEIVAAPDRSRIRAQPRALLAHAMWHRNFAMDTNAASRL
jgi:hypothetical protein